VDSWPPTATAVIAAAITKPRRLPYTWPSSDVWRVEYTSGASVRTTPYTTVTARKNPVSIPGTRADRTPVVLNTVATTVRAAAMLVAQLWLKLKVASV
jgi:hypothetical protein